MMDASICLYCFVTVREAREAKPWKVKEVIKVGKGTSDNSVSGKGV